MKRFLFITTTNLPTNPRLLKEVQLVAAQGHHAVVCMFHLSNWSDALNEAAMKQLPGVDFEVLSATRRPLFPWLLSSFLERIARNLPLHWLRGRVLSVAVGKRSWLLQNALRKYNGSFDWVIAHNPAAFYPAMEMAKRSGSKLGIDVEDYHPGETTHKKMQAVTKKLMATVLPHADYITYAAPLIMEEVQKGIPDLTVAQKVILNSFPSNEFITPVATADRQTLQLVWFSQHITTGRGLEKIIPVVNKLYPKVELHLIGELNASFDKEYMDCKIGIVLHETLSQKSLHRLLSNFDVGLATDLPVNRNRELALTNKILAYAQAGLVIAAMHTEAQDQFLASSDLYYVQMGNDPVSIKHALLQLYHDKQNGKIDKMQQYLKGQKFSWESNLQPLIKVWES